MGPEALPGAEAGDAPQPSEGVRKRGATEAEREGETGRGCSGGQRNRDFPRTGREVAERADLGVVEQNRKRGGIFFEPVRSGVRAVLAAERESGDAVERRETELRGFANPSGVRRVVVEENAGIVREAPGEGAAKRGRTGSGGHLVKTATAVMISKTNRPRRWQSFLRVGKQVFLHSRQPMLA